MQCNCVINVTFALEFLHFYFQREEEDKGKRDSLPLLSLFYCKKLSLGVTFLFLYFYVFVSYMQTGIVIVPLEYRVPVLAENGMVVVFIIIFVPKKPLQQQNHLSTQQRQKIKLLD